MKSEPKPWVATELKTLGQVAEYLLLSNATVSRMVALGQIPCMVLRVGRRKKIVRFKRMDIENWLRQRSHAGPGAHRPPRKSSRFGNGLATETIASPQPVEAEREKLEAHAFARLVPE